MTFKNLSSILDNDFYKITMQNGVFKLFPRAKVRYRFINRGEHSFPEGFGEALKRAVNDMERLQLTKEEKKYLEVSCPYLDPTYLDFLQGYRYDAEEVIIRQVGKDLSIEIEGLWYRTILWEVPLMSLVSELYYRRNDYKRVSDEEVINTAFKKAQKYDNLGVTIADFGTRRRHSYEVHRLVIEALKAGSRGSFVGTSNVHLAMLNEIKPIGTHAHEWFMFHAAQFGFKMANLTGLENWVKVFRGDLGIALSDTFTTEVFFEQFNKMFAKLFDGIRQDSGDPLLFADRAIEHYKNLNIDPLSKSIIFSDSLNYEKISKIAAHCRGRIGMSFGVGTNLTNDVGLKPLNMVIKMTEAFPEGGHWTPVVKLSDEKGKYTGEMDTIKLAKTILNIEEKAQTV